MTLAFVGDRYPLLVLNMSTQNGLIRALRCAIIALLLAAGVEGFKQLIFPSLSAWQLHITAILVCASIVFLLTFGLLCREHGQPEKLATGLLSDIAERKAAEETLRRLASIVEFSEDAIIVKTAQGVITNWNRAAEKMYGYTSAEAVGRDPLFLVPTQKQAEIQLIMERTRTGQSVECIETQRLTKEGSVLDVSLSISPIKDGNGQVTGASAIARDITHQKRAEEQLRLQSAALEAAANAIVITDFHGTIMWVNHAFTAMTGYSKEEALGNNLRLLKSGEQPEGY